METSWSNSARRSSERQRYSITIDVCHRSCGTSGLSEDVESTGSELEVGQFQGCNLGFLVVRSLEAISVRRESNDTADVGESAGS